MQIDRKVTRQLALNHNKPVDRYSDQPAPASEGRSVPLTSLLRVSTLVDLRCRSVGSGVLLWYPLGKVVRCMVPEVQGRPVQTMVDVVLRPKFDH